MLSSFDQIPVPVCIHTSFFYGHWKIWPDMECPMQHMSRFDISPPANVCTPHCSSLIHYNTITWYSCVFLQCRITTFTCRCCSHYGWSFSVRSPTWYLCLKYACCTVYAPPYVSKISEYIWQSFEHMYTTSCASMSLTQKKVVALFCGLPCNYSPTGLDWTVVHKCLPLLVPTQIHSCTSSTTNRF